MTERQLAFGDLYYFWKAKGDLERMTNFEKALELFPEIRRAWKKYKRAERLLNLLFKEGLSNPENNENEL